MYARNFGALELREDTGYCRIILMDSVVDSYSLVPTSIFVRLVGGTLETSSRQENKKRRRTVSKFR